MSSEIVIIPGDSIDITESDNEKVVLGPGLRRSANGNVVASKPGLLRQNANVYWIDSHSKRYAAAKGDNVVGIVVGGKSGADLFRVDIGTAENATLSYLAFEGATKKNRPNVNVGDVVYAKLVVAAKDAEAELVCVDAYGKKAGLGVLDVDGFVFTVPLHVVRKALSPDCVLLKALGKRIPFEIAVGMNGRIWIRAKSVKATVSLANAISAAEFMTNAQIEAMVNKLTDALDGF